MTTPRPTGQGTGRAAARRTATAGWPGAAGSKGRGVSDEELIRLASRLQDRDRLIVQYLAEYQVMTTQQIARTAFGSLRHTQKRLRALEQLGVVTSIRPRANTGSLPAHWILGAAGVVVRSIETGDPLREVTRERRRALTLVLGPKREHLVGVNDLFTRLVADPAGELTEWWPERQCAQRWADVILPDGYGEWVEAGRTVGWWLEYDRGTEPLAVLRDKAMAYADLQYVSGPGAERLWLLIVCTSPLREQHIRDALAGIEIACATASDDPGTSPAAAIWRPIDGDRPDGNWLDGNRFLRLADLAEAAAPEANAAMTPADWPDAR